MSDYLPNEVIREILARLPARTLLQMRCVCKSWCSLISSENFVTFHLNRTTQLNNINNTHLLLISHYTDIEKEEHISLYLDDEALAEYEYLNPENRPIANIRGYFTILGSCNGLVCLIDDIMTTADILYLWNPTIRKFVVLPAPRITFQSHGGYGRALGFGFDSTTNDYKVVRIVYLQVSGGTEVDIYSLKEGCWRNISVSGPIRYIDCEPSHAYLNGAIHWVSGGYACRVFMVLFNMCTEVFSEMELPTSLGYIRQARSLNVVVFQDSLCVFKSDTSECKASIWVMKEYGVVESWTNLFNLDFGRALSRRVDVIGLRRNGEVLLTKDEEMISVDIKTQKLKFVLNWGEVLLTKDEEMAPKPKYVGIRGYHDAFSVNTYTESLVLMDKVNGFGEQARYSLLQPLQAQRR